jgi:hypothetical protein
VAPDDELAVTQGHEVDDAQVDAHLTTGGRKWRGGHVDAAHAYPPPGPFALHRQGLGHAGYRSVIVHLHLADPEQAQAPLVPLQPPASPVLPLQGVPALGGLEAGKTWCLASVHSTIEAREGPIQAFERASTEVDPRGEHLGANFGKAGQRHALTEEGD